MKADEILVQAEERMEKVLSQCAAELNGLIPRKNMSLARLNRIVVSGLLPFNWGMDYEDWKALYASEPRLCHSDPSTWDAACINEVNANAQRERAEYERLMSLSSEEFNKELERITKE